MCTGAEIALVAAAVAGAGAGVYSAANAPDPPKPQALVTPEQLNEKADVELQSQQSLEDAARRGGARKNRLRVGSDAGPQVGPTGQSGTGLRVG